MRALRHGLASVAVMAGAVALVACSQEREAEVDTGTAEVEVSTTLPESQVSDEQLQSAAEGAAAMAETPGAGTAVVVTPPEGQAETTTPAPQ